jgi:hypothetical protein
MQRLDDEKTDKMAWIRMERKGSFISREEYVAMNGNVKPKELRGIERWRGPDDLALGLYST